MLISIKKIKNQKKFFSKGFSLVEMLVYMFILVLLLAVIMNIIISTVKSARTIRALRNIENSAILGMERIVREVRQAGSVDSGLSVFDINPGVLVLGGLDSNGNPRTVEFYLSSGKLMIKENGIETGALTQTDTQVDSLIFHHFVGPNSEGIRAEINIESGTSTYYRVENFYLSALLR